MALDLSDIAMPVFKGNFPRYKAELRIFLEAFSAGGLLDGSLVAPPPDASEDDKIEFADKERVLRAALHRGLGPRELTETLEACGNAAEGEGEDAALMWRKFVERQTHTTYAEHLARLEKFHNSPYERGMNVYKWIAEKIELGEMLSYGGLKISDNEMADVLLVGSRTAYPRLALELVSFNSIGEPMPRPKLTDVMDALGREWRLDQSEDILKKMQRTQERQQAEADADLEEKQRYVTKISPTHHRASSRPRSARRDEGVHSRHY